MQTLPENWTCSKVAKAATVIMGQSPDSQFVNEEEVGIPFLQGNAEFKDKHPTPVHWVTKPTKLSEKGDILISVRAPVGEINIADQEYCIGRGLAAIRFRDIDNQFGWFAIAYHKDQLSRLAQGSTFTAVSARDFSDFEITYPSDPAEQRAIADILSTLDEAIAQSEALVRKYQSIKQGLMSDLLTRGVDENGELRPESEIRPELFKETTIGKIPKSWQVVPVQYLYKSPIRDFGSFSMTNLITFLDSGIPFIKSEMIREDGLDTTTMFYISEDIHRLLHKSWVYPGNVLYSKIGSALGTALVYDGSLGVCNSNAAIAKIDVDDVKASSHFVAYLLNATFIKNRLKKSIISLLPRLNLGDISNFEVPLPSLNEQNQIVKILAGIDELINNVSDSLSKLILLRHGLMQDLLSGQVRVKYKDEG